MVISTVSCEEKPTPPLVTTKQASDISYTTAISGGDVTDGQGSSVNSKGICWNTSADPTISNTKTTNGNGVGAFTSDLNQLTPNTVYYIRAYASNSAGTGYGNQVTFTTLKVETATLSTVEVTAITQTTAVSGGNVTSENGGIVTARGVCWGTEANPTINNNKTTDGTGSGRYSSSLTGLTGNTTYYIRAYATNSAGTEYGSQLSFKTIPLIPSVSTVAILSISSTTAKSGGTIISDGGASITARGVVWSTTTNPTISLSTKTSDGLGTGNFASNLSGLSSSTKYYVKAYATNSSGTGYGEELAFTTSTPGVHDPNKIQIPVGGNSWGDNGAIIATEGLINWTNPASVCKTYIRLSQPGTLKVSLKMNANDGTSTIKVTVLNKSVELIVSGNIEKEIFAGEWDITSEGYLSIDVQGISKTGATFGILSDVAVSGSSVTSELVYVPDNDDNRFYWQRRGPSLHLWHDVTGTNNIEWFYSEIMVPNNNDVIGSYYMANGFGEGYFGMQVVTATERRVLFSIWSPFETNDPGTIPPEDQVILVRKGANVITGTFGNEGSGGQSYLKYNWSANNNYKFLVQGKPVENNCTQYTAWFFASEESKWLLIASWKRPKTSTYLKGLYSFIENFNTETGNTERMAFYGNEWIKENGGVWKELSKATLTGSETVFRKDYSGGIAGGSYFLKVSGHFNEYSELNIILIRPSGNIPPGIEFSTLP
jgi:FlaG/FlaF family flagellin (archaellin)